MGSTQAAAKESRPARLINRRRPLARWSMGRTLAELAHTVPAALTAVALGGGLPTTRSRVDCPCQVVAAVVVAAGSYSCRESSQMSEYFVRSV